MATKRTKGGKIGRKSAKKPARKVLVPEAPAPAAAGPPDLEEALAEPLFDASGVFRVSNQLAHAKRDSDEDEQRLFRDPSMIIRVESTRRDGRKPR